MDTEDFSFPRINDSFPHSIDSPPMWNLSPAASPNPYQGNHKGGKTDCFGAKVVAQAQRKSFSCVQNGSKRIGLGDEEDEDEDEDDRMDLLWEDLNFNEELSSCATSSSREGAEFRCAQVLTLAKNNKGALLPTKHNKPGMVVIVNVMKRLFSMKNSQGKSRKRVR